MLFIWLIFVVPSPGPYLASALPSASLVKSLKVPTGFNISLVDADLTGARSLAVAGDGRLVYVSSNPKTNKV